MSNEFRADESPMRATMRRMGSVLLMTTVAALALASIAALLDLPWPWSVAQLVKQQLVLWGAGISVLLLLLRRWRYAAIPAVVAGANYLAMAAAPFAEARSDSTSEAQLTVVWANVVFGTPTLNRALDYAREQQADLVLIGAVPNTRELTDEFVPALPFRHDTNGDSSSCESPSRVIALSRFPISDAEVLPGPPCDGRQFLKFSIVPEVGSGPLQVIAVHVDAPLSGEAHRRRNDLIAKVAASVEGGRYLVAGDFNATPWSAAFRRLPGRRVGDPKWETTVRQWQFDSWNLLAFAIPVDHFLISESIRPSHYGVGPDIGSIHRPIVARLRFSE